MFVGPDYDIVALWNVDVCAIAHSASHWLLTARGAGYSYRAHGMGFMMDKVAPRNFFLSQNIGFAPAGYHSADAAYYFSAFLPWYSRPSLMRRDLVTRVTWYKRIVLNGGNRAI